MTTFTDVVEDVLSTMRGTVRSQEQSTYITTAVDDSELVWSVANAGRLAPGRAECGDELIYLDQFSIADSTVTIAPYGRGIDGTTAATHDLNAQVISNPRFPKIRVRNAINDTIRGVAGQLFTVSTTNITTTSDAISYELPADTYNVVGVAYETSDTRWVELGAWRFNSNADTTDFPSGKSLSIGQAAPGLAVEVSCLSYPTPFNADADTLLATVGLPESCRDVIVLGACWRLLSTIDIGEISNSAISAADLDNAPGYGRTGGEGMTAATTIYKMFQMRLAEERKKLLDIYPSRIHYS